ncbi:MAG: hypothetical protein AAFU65_05885, partial [Pseudomonadota bacterium]
GHARHALHHLVTKEFIMSLPIAMSLLLTLSPLDASAVPHQVATPEDGQRGCCVLALTPARCAPTNRGYCRALAEESSSGYKFYPGARCQAVAACGVQQEPSAIGALSPLLQTSGLP